MEFSFFLNQLPMFITDHKSFISTKTDVCFRSYSCKNELLCKRGIIAYVQDKWIASINTYTETFKFILR